MGDRAARPSVLFGLRGGWEFDADIPTAGAQLRLPFAMLGRTIIVPNGDIFFAEGEADWQINLDINQPAGLLPGLYQGMGLAVVNREFDAGEPHDVEVGANLLLGLKPIFRRAPIQPFVESRWTFVYDEVLYHLAVGFDIRLGGGPKRPPEIDINR